MYDLDFISISYHGDFDVDTAYYAEPYCISCKYCFEVRCDTPEDAFYIEDNCTFCKLCQMYICRPNTPAVSGQKYNTSGGSQPANIVRDLQQNAHRAAEISAPIFKPYYTSAADAEQGCIVIDSDEEYADEAYADDKYDAVEDALFARMPSTRFKSASKKRRSRTTL